MCYNDTFLYKAFLPWSIRATTFVLIPFTDVHFLTPFLPFTPHLQPFWIEGTTGLGTPSSEAFCCILWSTWNYTLSFTTCDATVMILVDELHSFDIITNGKWLSIPENIIMHTFKVSKCFSCHLLCSHPLYPVFLDHLLTVYVTLLVILVEYCPQLQNYTFSLGGLVQQNTSSMTFMFNTCSINKSGLKRWLIFTTNSYIINGMFLYMNGYPCNCHLLYGLAHWNNKVKI